LSSSPPSGCFTIQSLKSFFGYSFNGLSWFVVISRMLVATSVFFCLNVGIMLTDEDEEKDFFFALIAATCSFVSFFAKATHLNQQ